MNRGYSRFDTPNCNTQSKSQQDRQLRMQVEVLCIDRNQYRVSGVRRVFALGYLQTSAALPSLTPCDLNGADHS